LVSPKAVLSWRTPVELAVIAASYLWAWKVCPALRVTVQQYLRKARALEPA
jgi:hypothetical protein